MAKQASKPKPRTSGRAGPASSKATTKSSTASPAAAKPRRKTAAQGPAAPAKRGAASARTAGKPQMSPGKGAKLQAAGKAITSGHSPAAAKSGEDGSPRQGKKQPAARASSTTPAPSKAKSASASRAPKKKTKAAKRVTFDRKTLLAIKKSLQDQRKDLVGQLEELEESAFSPSQAEASSEAGSDDDYADAGTVTFEREKDLSIANNINNLVDKIDKALEKIEEGSYGLCENCGQPIGADRLKALPHVVLCINCKKAEERR